MIPTPYREPERDEAVPEPLGPPSVAPSLAVLWAAAAFRCWLGVHRGEAMSAILWCVWMVAILAPVLLAVEVSAIRRRRRAARRG